MNPKIHISSYIDQSAKVHENVVIWQNSQIRENVVIGEGTVIGSNCYIGPGVKIGRNCRIQSNSLIYEICTLGDFVFIGPGVIVTNDLYPRAFNKNYNPITTSDWIKTESVFEDFSSVGAGVICIGPVVVEKFVLIGAGSVIKGQLFSHGLYVGNIAKRIDWVGEDGKRLKFNNESEIFESISDNKKYIQNRDRLVQI